VPFKSSKIEIYIGKGGVGKSSISSLRAVSLSKMSIKTHLVSFDPAHNIKDIFNLDKCGKNVRFSEFLEITEYDIDDKLKNYINSIKEIMKKQFAFESFFGIDTYTDAVSFVPGMIEYGSLLGLFEILENTDSYDFIIIDMPPTALALRILSSPRINLKWCDMLINLRKKIIEKKSLIVSIKDNIKNYKEDLILQKLYNLRNKYIKLEKILYSNKNCTVNLVSLSDMLSLKESQRIINSLCGLKISFGNFYLNKANDKSKLFSFFKTNELQFFKNVINIPFYEEFDVFKISNSVNL